MIKKLIPILLTCACAGLARADFNPVVLTPSSYTYNIVVPATGVQPVPTCVNAFSGSGQCLSCDNTFYEQGMVARPGEPWFNSGIPVHNTVFTNINNANMTFLMPPDYTKNNDLMVVNNTGSGYGDIPSGTFTFASPTTATSLAILCSDGNGTMTVNYVVTHSDNSTESGNVTLQDWFNGGATVAWGANGRMDQNGDFNNFNSSSVNNNAPYLYANVIGVSSATPIVSITFNYITGGSVANFYAVSGANGGSQYTPIPVTGFNVISTIPAYFPVTATMDEGTNTMYNGNLNTWFEQGYDQADPTAGLPPSGSIFNSLSEPTHHYQMGNYSANNAILIDTNHLTVNITPASLANYTAISLLTAGANIGGGTMVCTAVLQHADGVNETDTFYGYDWFNTSVPASVAWDANGRVNLSNRTLNNINNTTPSLFETYFQVNDTTSPITNIVVNFGSAPSPSSTTYIMAVSGSLAGFNPVALTPSSYTYSLVVPAGTVQAVPACVNAFSGSGQCLSCDNTFYEQGMVSRVGDSGSNSGIPIHNTVFTNINNANMAFLMPPDYTTNNDLMIVNNPGQNYGDIPTGTFTFVTPTTATSLALLCSDGNGGMSVNYVVTHTDNSTESGSISLNDWFSGGSSVAWGANGRMDQNGDYNNYNSSSVNNNAPYLYANTISVSGATPIKSITFNYVSGGSVANFYAVSGANGGSQYTPIPVTGFNVISTIAAAFPITATMDQGTNTAYNGNLATWFEQGYDRSDLTAGVPPSGSTFTSISQPTHNYQMGNYAANNAILIDTNHLTVNITPANPQTYSAYSFLTAGGNIGGGNAMVSTAILQHADGVNETKTFSAYDWFNTANNAAIAWKANGRVNMANRTLNNINNNFPYLFETYFQLADTTSPVTNIVVNFGTAPSVNSTTYILAVSANAGGVPPVITAGPTPATQTWYPSQSAVFTVQTTGTAPLTNSWLVENGSGVYVPLTDGLDANGSTIIGSATTTLTISNLALADANNYEFVVSSALGSATSAPAILVMNSGTPSAPIIDSQTPGASFGILSGHLETTTFSVAIDSTSATPLFYQWYNGSTPIPSATNASYVNLDSSAATFSCVISNFVGSVTTTPVSISFFTAPTPTAYAAAVMALHPVAFWPLNETAGNIAFDYAGTNDGIYTGTCTLGQGGLSDGNGNPLFSASVGFDGSSAYVDVPVGKLNITGPITLIQWVNSQETGFASSLGHSDQSYRLDVDGSGDAHFADAGPDIVDPTSINDGNWHLLIGIYDGTKQYLYVDGHSVGTPAAGNAPAGSTDDVWIGGAPDYGTGRLFNGSIASVAIIPSALTAAQVSSLYNIVGVPPTIVGITPVSPAVYVGNNITLTAQLSGTTATKLQWFVINNNGVSNNIAGATGLSYTLTNATLVENNYTYGINAGNAYGIASASVTLTVSDAAAFLGSDLAPLSGEAYAGAPVTYMVNAQGSLPIHYQWLVNNTAVSGATNATFTLAAPCGLTTIQATVTNALSQANGGPVSTSVAQLQGDASPTNVTFNTDGTGWTLNTDGATTVPTISAGVLELTDGSGGEGVSSFYDVAQYVGSFTASFTYSGLGGADGTVFIVQNNPQAAAAIGEPGGALGYYPITNSVGLEFNLYTGNGEVPGMAAGTNGNTFPDGGGAEYAQPSPSVIIGGGDPIAVVLNWANGVLNVNLTDTLTKATVSTNYVYGSLVPILGGNLGFVGFSGADGGAVSVQTISNFEFHSVIPPVSLAVSPVTDNTFTIWWSSADPSYELQTTSSLTKPAWVAGPATVTAGGVTSATVNVTSGGAAQFYRLVRVTCP